MQHLHSKQPKVGEVWCFDADYNSVKALWHIRRVVEDHVIIQNIHSGYTMSRSIKGFITDNTFVF